MAVVSAFELRSAIPHPPLGQRWNESELAIAGLEKAQAQAARFGVNVKFWVEDPPAEPQTPSELPTPSSPE